VKLESFNVQQTMKRKLIRTLVVVLVAFAAFVFVWPDDLWEHEAAYTQSEILKQSSHGIPAHPDRQGVYSSLIAASNKSAYSPTSAAMATSPILASLSTCVLLC